MNIVKTNIEGVLIIEPLFPQEREDVTALRCSEPLRYKVVGPSKVFDIFCGMGPHGAIDYNIS